MISKKWEFDKQLGQILPVEKMKLSDNVQYRMREKNWNEINYK